MTDEDNNQRSRAGFSKSLKSYIGRIIWEQVPIHQQHIYAADWHFNQRSEPIGCFANHIHFEIKDQDAKGRTFFGFGIG
jgi:hypothetical protein